MSQQHGELSSRAAARRRRRKGREVEIRCRNDISLRELVRVRCVILWQWMCADYLSKLGRELVRWTRLLYKSGLRYLVLFLKNNKRPVMNDTCCIDRF